MAQNNGQRPTKKDFTSLVVIGPNAQIVDPQEVKRVVGNAEGRELNKILKQNKWSSTKYFDQEAYDNAVREFREGARSKTQESRKTIMQRAFDEAGVETHPRIESALRTVMPLMDFDQNEERSIRALSKIVSAVDSVMIEQPRRGKADGGKGDSNRDGGRQASGSEAGGNSRQHPGAETTAEGQRINKDGSIDKRTKPEGGVSEATAKARGEGNNEAGRQGGQQANSGPGHQRGEAGEGGQAEDGRMLRKDGQPDKRTKPEGGISEATAKARGQGEDDQLNQDVDNRLKNGLFKQPGESGDVQEIKQQLEELQSKLESVEGGQGEQQAKSQGDNSGTDGKRSAEKEDSQGNFVGKNGDRGGNGGNNRKEAETTK